MNETRAVKEPKMIHFDVSTIKNCQKYADERGLSFSSVIRLATNEFFLKMEGHQ